MDQLAERLAQHVRELRNFVRGHDLQDLSDVVRLGRARPRKALEDDDAERPNVSAVVDVPLAEDLLWRHVILGSEHRAGSREPSSVRAVVVSRRELGDAEVEHLDDWPVWRLREEDVVRLKIAVDDPARVRCADRRNHWQEDPREFPNRQDGLAIEAAPRATHQGAAPSPSSESCRPARGRRGSRRCSDVALHKRRAPRARTAARGASRGRRTEARASAPRACA